ncbi:MAG: tetratricopeptide repeat protein, partial [Gelidibacter sp.]
MKFVIFFFFLSVVAIGQTDLEKAEQFLADKQFTKAQDLMVSYVKNHPDRRKAIELLGDIYGHQKKWDEAIENYKILVDLSPKSANYHYKYGGALGMKALSISKIKAVGIIGDAKHEFITAADLDPKHIDTRWALVELYMQLPGIIGGSKSKALKYADELQSLSKVDGYLAKGYIYEYDKEFFSAEKYYKLAITEGGSLVCYEKLTNLYEHQKQYDKAIANMEAAYSKHKQNLLNYQIGKLSADYNVQLDKGKTHLRTYLKNYSQLDEMPKAWANYRFAQVYKLQKKKADSLRCIELAIGELPKEESFNKEKTTILSLK